jgi:hypothetical protein
VIKADVCGQTNAPKGRIDGRRNQGAFATTLKSARPSAIADRYRATKAMKTDSARQKPRVRRLTARISAMLPMAKGITSGLPA